MQKFLNNRITAILLPAILGLGAGALSVMQFAEYGWTLFLLLPVIISFLSTFFWSFKREVSFGTSYCNSLASILLLGSLILVVGLDGLICLLMALPLAMILAVPGVTLGLFAVKLLKPAQGGAVASLLCLSFPFLLSFEHSTAPEPEIRKVVTSVEIEAGIEEVWKTVIAFPKIEDPPKGIFRLGIAYPVEARIDGHGVGAIRYCNFSTGDFVEPITTWDRPNLLAFDVSENPPPMKEFSLHDDFHAPHLHGHMVSHKGQFRLIPQEGKIILEGTTWYSHSIAPAFYWGPISDEIIHRIHERVLNHIKNHAEAGKSKSA